MLALAIYVVQDGKPLTADNKKMVQNPVCSGKLRTLSDHELLVVKQAITSSLKYIKAYSGSSRTWLAYQNSLSEGCNRLATVISDLPVSIQTARILVDLLLRLDKKLCTGGVDDSDGEVGGFIEEVVSVLQEFIKLDHSCVNAFDKLKNKETCFGWEESLLKTNV